MGKGFRLLLAIVAGCVGLVVAYVGGAIVFYLWLVAQNDLAQKDAADLARRVPVGSTVEQVEHLVGRPPDLRTGYGVPWDGNPSAMPEDVAVRGRFTHQWVVGKGRLIVRFDRHAVVYAHGTVEPPFVEEKHPVVAGLWTFFFWWMPSD